MTNSTDHSKIETSTIWKKSEIKSIWWGIAILFTSSLAMFWVNSFSTELNKQLGFIPIVLFMGLIGLFIVGGSLVTLPIWDHLKIDTQELLRKAGITIGAVVGISLFFFHGFILGGQGWSGEGEVNLFPSDDASKNYRVAAEINVQTKPWGGREYEISEVTWPNGGYTGFSNCIISTDINTCSDDEGREWTIEVHDAPDYDPPSE